MPELPEVETTVQALRKLIVGQTIADAEVKWPRSIAIPSPDAFSQQATGRGVADVTRRGKFTIVRLLPLKFVVVHLGMTGHLLADHEHRARDLEGRLVDRYTRVLIRFASGWALRFRDVRKFGRIYLVDDPCDIPLLRDLGPEPLSAAFTPPLLGEMLQRHRRQLKPLLLNQRFVAGLGNIYTDESLWQARIHPQTPSHALNADDVVRLHDAIRKVLTQAIQKGGTTLRDYRDPHGEPGSNQWSLSVYGLDGEPCKRCGHAIHRTVVGGRSTHYCPACQPLCVEWRADD